MKTSIKLIFPVFIIFSFFSCEDENGNGGIGPCVHTYKEPILHITSVRNTLNNVHLSFVQLRELRINGLPQTGYGVISESYSIVFDDSIFYCNVPFGFGIENGKYEFIIEAEGYPPKLFSIENVGYSIFKGGCPSYNDGGKRVELFID
jgi:hypothetical protein